MIVKFIFRFMPLLHQKASRAGNGKVSELIRLALFCLFLGAGVVVPSVRAQNLISERQVRELVSGIESGTISSQTLSVQLVEDLVRGDSLEEPALPDDKGQTAAQLGLPRGLD